MKSLFLACILVVITTNAASAQQSGYIGMHHLKPKPAPTNTPPEKAAEVPEEKTTEIPKNEDHTDVPVYTALPPEDALVEPEDLEEWNHIGDAALAHNDVDIQNLIRLVESDRGAVPPHGLFLISKSLADRNRMEQAALYYFVGQLRLNFDVARWPPTPDPEDIKRRQENSQKSPDQAAPNLESKPRIYNPHQGIQSLADQIGGPIISWILKNPDRMTETIKNVKSWDESAPYSYLPDYDLTEAVPFQKWKKLLVRTRETFFDQMTAWTNIMSKIKR